MPPRVCTLGAADGLQIQVADLGARWLSCLVPMPDGTRREVLLGHASVSDHAQEPGYLGAVVGRYGNRIANASFALDGQVHQLLANEGRRQLHGGPDGFDRRHWTIAEQGPLQLRLQLHSPVGDQGYPGALDAEVTYRVDPAARSVSLGFSATVDAPCPVNLVSHAYYNLDGDARGVQGHRLRVAASHVLPVDSTMIPTGRCARVDGSAFDLRRLRPLGDGLGQGEQQQLAGGYDHCFVLDADAAMGAAPAAELLSSDGRLSMRLYTNYPGLQLYSGNHLASAHGRDGLPYAAHAGVALEPQFFPDAPNQPAWRDQGCVLRPCQRLARWMRLSFEAR